VSFGVPWLGPGRLPADRPAALRGDDLKGLVRRAAEQIVADLDRAARWADRWRLDAVADALVDAALSRCLGRLAATGCLGEANRLPSGDLWHVAGPWLEKGSLQRHARLKPHGYAGDHEMLTRIWEQTLCDDPLGCVFDRYFLAQAAPQAVRARISHAAAALVDHALRKPAAASPYCAASVGSGPAIDLREAMLCLPPGRRCAVRLRLLDLDPRALELARAALVPLVGEAAVRDLRTNLLRLAGSGNPDESIGRPDFLVCSGLFDYLSDEAARDLLELFWRQLAPGGLGLIGNFAPHNPTRPYMEWIGNWYLTYRTAEELTHLARAAGIPRDCRSLRTERLGVNVFLLVEKPA
jgi:extracellular factor (EF) 3-hydroxypalmitic acid methyl ester biosynthesis protein